MEKKHIGKRRSRTGSPEASPALRPQRPGLFFLPTALPRLSSRLAEALSGLHPKFLEFSDLQGENCCVILRDTAQQTAPPKPLSPPSPSGPKTSRLVRTLYLTSRRFCELYANFAIVTGLPPPFPSFCLSNLFYQKGEAGLGELEGGEGKACRGHGRESQERSSSQEGSPWLITNLRCP